MKFHNSKREGFTLIELLVVVSIIGLLSSIALASLSLAREKARIAAGQSFSSSLYRVYGAEAVGQWDFDETSGIVTKNEITGTMDSITGVGAGITRVAGIRGNALYFDGVNGGFVDIVDTALLPKFTLSIWVNHDPTGDQRHSIVNSFWEIVTTSGLSDICFWSYSFANLYWRCTTGGAVQNGKWVNIASSWDGSIMRHYIDGKLVWTDTAASSGTSQAFATVAGYSDRKYKGALDELRIYTQALGSAQIEQIYAEGIAGRNIALNDHK